MRRFLMLKSRYNSNSELFLANNLSVCSYMIHTRTLMMDPDKRPKSLHRSSKDTCQHGRLRWHQRCYPSSGSIQPINWKQPKETNKVRSKTQLGCISFILALSKCWGKAVPNIIHCYRTWINPSLPSIMQFKHKQMGFFFFF